MAWQQQSFCHQMCYVLCVCGTAHNLLVDEWSQCLGPSETKWVTLNSVIATYDSILIVADQ